jgi:V/A-type H+-transporting ATPase subunit I
VGRLDGRRQDELRENLADRAVIIPLDDTGRVLAAASRKGRFALDSALKKAAFTPIAIPEGYKGVPSDLLSSLEERLAGVETELNKIEETKSQFKKEYDAPLCGLCVSFLVAQAVEDIKGRLRGTKNVYVVNGWVPADEVAALAAEMETRTEGRAAIRSYNPEEIEDVREGREKVPVSLKHGAFVKSFEPVVFSYGAPLYGTIDPTPFVAFFFTILFGIMFGDAGQGLVLLFLGFAVGRGPLASFKKFAGPLKAVGISSIVMGFLSGEFFTMEGLFAVPTRAAAGFVMRLFGMEGEPPERILHLMPEKGSVLKIFYFFGFTIAVGVILNSIGLVVNILNQCSLKKYEKAFFSKTGLAGTLLFWYALFIAVRILAGGSFSKLDYIGLFVPAGLVFFGPAIWRLASGARPVLEHGLLVFIMEGFVEILESASTYISNTVSFLRVGAFALSHAVLSFIVFTLSEMVRDQTAGPALALAIMIFGNAVIILLEGMIVAIQVVRLQYYEFFSKFFTETGVEFKPFRFRN